MGCDIHLYVEKKVAGKWAKVGGMRSDYYKPGDKFFGTEEYRSTDQPYGGRNYTVFAALANVRNGHGFAGCDTGDALTPIAMPKGLPDDVSDAVQQLSDDYGGDGHSHSHLTLAEILAYDWDRPLVSRGMVELPVFKKLPPGGDPHEWCGMVSGGSVKIITPADVDTYQPKPGESVYVQYQWTVPLRKYCAHFLNHMLPILKKLAGKKTEDVRIVFWFDN